MELIHFMLTIDGVLPYYDSCNNLQPYSCAVIFNKNLKNLVPSPMVKNSPLAQPRDRCSPIFTLTSAQQSGAAHKIPLNLHGKVSKASCYGILWIYYVRDVLCIYCSINNTHIYTYISIYTYKYMYINICMYTYIYVYIYMYICIYIYVSMYIYI